MLEKTEWSNDEWIIQRQWQHLVTIAIAINNIAIRYKNRNISIAIAIYM
jgi:PhoPQ-activated pathogenicity-related protein